MAGVVWRKLSAVVPLAMFSLLPLFGSVEAQEQDLTRSWTILAGLGNDMGGFGVRAEYYLQDQLSVFGGIGYIPEVDKPDYKGVTGAVGVRAYSSGPRHRGFIEGGVSQLAGSMRCPPLQACERSRHFGPAVLAGYQFVATGGFSLQVGAGAGYLVSPPDDIPADRIQPVLSLGFGYTVW